MKINGTPVYRLTDRHGTGYAGFGYGGSNLYVVCVVDTFDPPRYLVRADSWTDAYETAEECLIDGVDPATLADYGIVGGLDGVAAYVADHGDLPEGLTVTASGRLIDSDQDIRVSEVRCHARTA